MLRIKSAPAESVSEYMTMAAATLKGDGYQIIDAGGANKMVAQI